MGGPAFGGGEFVGVFEGGAVVVVTDRVGGLARARGVVDGGAGPGGGVSGEEVGPPPREGEVHVYVVVSGEPDLGRAVRERVCGEVGESAGEGLG